MRSRNKETGPRKRSMRAGLEAGLGAMLLKSGSGGTRTHLT